MKSYILFIVSVLLAGSCLASEQQGSSRRIEWRLAQQQDRIHTIDERIDQERKAVERWYARELADVMLSAEREAGYLLAVERVLITALTTATAENPILLDRWGSFFPRTASILQSRGLINTNQRRAALRLFKAAKDHYYLNKTKKLLMDKNFRSLLEGIVNSTQLASDDDILLRYEAGRLIAIMDKLSEESRSVENQREAKHAALDERARLLKSEVYQVMQEIKVRPANKPTGVIAAICCGGKDSFCMIEGVDGLVREGATLAGGIKVLEISENKVRFESNEGKWEQKIGQAPGSQWK